MTTVREPLNALQVAEAICVPYHHIDRWTSHGYLHTTGPANPGQGHTRYYLPEEVEVARWMAYLWQLGMPPSAAARLARDPELRAVVGAALVGEFAPQVWEVPI